MKVTTSHSSITREAAVRARLSRITASNAAAVPIMAICTKIPLLFEGALTMVAPDSAEERVSDAGMSKTLNDSGEFKEHPVPPCRNCATYVFHRDGC
jgi:hypothetical protein